MSERHEATILALIAAAEAEHGFDALSGGNCGQFAIGMARHLRSSGTPANLAFLNRKTEAEDVSGLLREELDLYHVVLELDGRYFDCTGKVDADGLIGFSLREYGDGDPEFWTEVEPDETARRIVSQNTAWTIEWCDFLETFARGQSPSL